MTLCIDKELLFYHMQGPFFAFVRAGITSAIFKTHFKMLLSAKIRKFIFYKKTA